MNQLMICIYLNFVHVPELKRSRFNFYFIETETVNETVGRAPLERGPQAIRYLRYLISGVKNSLKA